MLRQASCKTLGLKLGIISPFLPVLSRLEIKEDLSIRTVEYIDSETRINLRKGKKGKIVKEQSSFSCI